MIRDAMCIGLFKLSGDKLTSVSERPDRCKVYVLVKFWTPDIFGTTSCKYAISDGDEFYEVIDVSWWKYASRQGVTGYVLKAAGIGIDRQPPLMINGRMDSGDVEFLKKTINDWLAIE